MSSNRIKFQSNSQSHTVVTSLVKITRQAQKMQSNSQSHTVAQWNLSVVVTKLGNAGHCGDWHSMQCHSKLWDRSELDVKFYAKVNFTDSLQSYLTEVFWRLSCVVCLLNKASKFCQHLLWNPTVLIEGGCFCAAGVCTVIRFKEDLTVYGLLKQQQFPAVSAPCRHTLHQHRTTLVYISNQWNAGHRGVSLRDVCSQCKYTVLHTVSKVWTRTVAITQELSWQVEADTHITGDIHIMNIDSAHAHSVHMDSWKYSLVTATLLSFVLHPVSMILGPLIV